MNEGLIEAWNKTVPEDGIVIHCGDFMLSHSSKDAKKDYPKFLEKLHYSKLIGLNGNHGYLTCGDQFLRNHFKLEESFQDYKLIILDNLFININGIKVFCSHYPVYSAPTQYVVHGHTHVRNNYTGNDYEYVKHMAPNMIDVGVDHANALFGEFRPMSWKEVKERLDLQISENKNQFNYLTYGKEENPET